MKTRNSFAAWSGVFAVLALVTGCGGGGGGGSPTPAVAITTQPADRSVVAGTAATFDVVATNATGYRWQRSTDGGSTYADVAGAASASYTTPVTALADDGTRYRVVVSNAAGPVTSGAALLTVSAAPGLPAFTYMSEGATVIAPDPATFTVVATGTPTPTLQWQVSTDGGATFADLAGATGSSYTTPATGAADDGNRYRVVATNSVGPARSSAASLTVRLPTLPSFTTQPVDVAIIAGGSAQFTVAVSGTPTPTLQWQLSTDGGGTWTDVQGATGTAFDVSNAALANDGRRFRAVATNRAGVVSSNAATLTVTPAGLVSITTTSPLPQGTVNAAYGVTFAASGGTPPYTWSPADGYTLPAFLTLDASTGQISGTLPDVEAIYSLNIRVTDSANPPNAAEGTFELSAVRPCDHGLGFLTADNAPPSVGGKFCPTTVTAQLVPNNLGLVYVVWNETHDYGGGAYFESFLVEFYPTGVINALSYHLSDPTHLVDYDCTLTGDAYRRACSGATLDPALGEIYLLNTDVGLTPAWTVRLNGLLFYVP
jgi:hypothetical protein